jgi:hypothetical protein
MNIIFRLQCLPLLLSCAVVASDCFAPVTDDQLRASITDNYGPLSLFLHVSMWIGLLSALGFVFVFAFCSSSLTRRLSISLAMLAMIITVGAIWRDSLLAYRVESVTRFRVVSITQNYGFHRWPARYEEAVHH